MGDEEAAAFGTAQFWISQDDNTVGVAAAEWLASALSPTILSAVPLNPGNRLKFGGSRLSK
jgi:hypothetical protein